VTPDAAPRRADLPDWFPPWAVQLADLYFSGTTAAFVLYGNTQDLFRVRSDKAASYGVLAEFLAEQLFGRWSLVLHYDLGGGLRAFAGRDEQRLKETARSAISARCPRIPPRRSRRSIAWCARTSWPPKRIASASR